MSTTAKLSVVIAVLFVCQPVFGQGKRGRLAGFGQGNQDANAATDANGGGAGFGRRRIDRGTGGPNADQRTGTGGAAPAAGRGGQFTRGLGAAPSPGASPAAGGFQRGGGGGIETALKRFDTNNDGMIDAKEAADPTAKNLLDRIWSRMGKEPHYPIAVSDLAQAFQTRGPTGPQQGNSPSTAPAAPARATVSLPGMGFGTPAVASTSKPATPGILPPGPRPDREASSRSPALPATAKAEPPAQKLSRFHTGIESRPQGLPQWFIDKDRNGDGQITMAQYATNWTPALVAEFNKYDLNHDGIITAEEVLKVLGITAGSAAKAAPTAIAAPAAKAASSAIAASK